MKMILAKASWLIKDEETFGQFVRAQNISTELACGMQTTSGNPSFQQIFIDWVSG